VIKGLKKLQPARPRYSDIWDAGIVERYLRSLGEDSMLESETLAGKLSSLLLMHCFVRFTEQATIRLASVRFNSSNTVSFSVVSKTNQVQPTLIDTAKGVPIPARSLIYSCIKEYTHRLNTAPFRCTPATPLLTNLASGIPYQADQLRQMAKSLMAAAGIDTTRFTAYSLKAASISGRAAAGESVAQLEEAARLSHRSKTLQKYYLMKLTKH
jgi:hypothetical protein